MSLQVTLELVDVRLATSMVNTNAYVNLMLVS